MVVNPYSTTVTSNVFNTKTASPSPSGKSGNFEEQLSSVITDSLKKLGVAPGEVNISIKNPGGAAATQIVISYNREATAAETSAPSEGVPAEETPATAAPPRANPFTMAAAFMGPPPEATTPSLGSTDWSPWDGPRDRRDATPVGGGTVTESGAPRIQLNTTPAANQYNYTGPAALNPYFTTPSNPLREGYVVGFENWFTQPFILGAEGGPVPANKALYSTAEGAQEALRIVQQFEPEAQVDQATWGGGPFASSVPMHYISLPGGRLISAGGILSNYYNGGRGVTTASDAMLTSTLRLA